MVGPASLRTKKALLTRYCNNLSRVIERINSAHTAAQASSDDATSPPRIKASLFELDATAKLAADALNAFTAALDEIDELPEEQDKQANDYIDSSLSLIERARLMAIELDAKNIGDREENDERGWTEMMRPKLPPIPIPIFTGKVQEYTNFWTLFESNVDRQPLTNLQKFNYLITALRGEPRELIKRYPITEANYTHAIQLLRDKYGDESKLIADLQSLLEMTKADNKSIYAQRRLLEQILPIVTQLEELGITLNGSYPTKKLLSKFSYTLQRQVLERCLLQNKKETDWIMRDVLSELDDLITTQEQISEMIDSIPNKCDDRSRDSHNNNRSKKFLMKNATTKPDPNACMFCGSTQHKSADCTRIPSIHQRRTYMQQHRRCLNCGKEGHFVKDCTSKGCRYCTGMKHHHTLCPQRHNLGETTDQTPPRARTNTNTPQNRPPVPNVPRSTKRHVKTAVATAQPVQTTDSSATYPDITDTAQHSPQDTSILQNSTVDALDNKVLLLTGVARVRDEARDDWKEVEILFDTGADQSFISSALAEELNLKCTKEKELTMYTFGSTDPKPTKCRHTTLDLWDNQGQKHPVRLCTTPVLTSKGQTTQLDHADLAFVAQHNIHLSKPTSNSTSIPQILLGCDQLWGLLDAPLPRFKLPSGLLLIPSKLGYLLTGKQHTFHGIEGQQNEVNISMITMVEAFTESEDEMSRWDRYWTMDSAGICEFTGTKNEEKTAVNEQEYTNFWTLFESNVDRQPLTNLQKFNYLITALRGEPRELIKRYPITEANYTHAIQLLRDKYGDESKLIADLQSLLEMTKADNKSIYAQRRLLEQILPIVTQLEELGITLNGSYPTKKLLSKFSYTLQRQVLERCLLQNKKETDWIMRDVLSELDDLITTQEQISEMIDSIPNKCDDRSRDSHNNNRSKKFLMKNATTKPDPNASISDVHLNEMDRDATRFIWVRDVDLPVTEDNIVTYRFTRVTFGLNVSPFLLAGTVTYHLHHVVENKELAKEIKDNLYVDNLILAARTPEDLAKKVVDSREIFQDMGMNLREFLANDKIPELRTIQDTTMLLGQHIKAARIALLRNHQSSFLSHYHKKLRNDTLRLYQDKDLLWRSQGRLQNSTLGADAKSPIFVAPNTPLSQLIIKDAHGDYHQGVEHTIATIRQTYWIPKIRQQVRKLVSKCVQCRRLNALPYPYPDMTDLPQQRVIRSHPFQHIGLDFFDLPSTHLEAGKTHGYGCIFTCMVTRLIHLEMVDSMSTEDSSTPYEDLWLEEWNHITPYAPWQGGFYERLIKSVKHALYKSLRGTNHRSGDHLRTILTEIEACLNSRPLTYQGDGQEDFSSIRPIDFLQKDLTLTLPTTHLTDHMTNDPDYHTPDEIRALQTRQE
ncbi:zinc knuckle, partial [Ancylostoma ceylanicum]